VSRIRDNWRIALLVLLLLGSAIAIFAPGGGLSAGPNATTTGPTNLQFGLDLSGGTRIRAPLVGVTATGVNVTSDNRAQLQGAVVANLPNVTRSVVDVRFPSETSSSGGTIEVFANVTPAQLRTALDESNVGYDSVRRGVTQPTRDSAVRVIGKKIDATGLAGGTVQITHNPQGEYFVVVEVPNHNTSEVQKLVKTRGLVEIVARHPGKNGTAQNDTVLTQQDMTSIDPVHPPDNSPGGINSWYVGISLSQQGAQRFTTDMKQYGFTGDGVDSCRDSQGNLQPSSQRYCVNTVLDGRVVYRANMAPGLAQDIENGQFEKSRSFVITAPDQQTASQLRLNMQSGALPTTLDLTRGTSNYISPSLAENFKFYSVIIGLVAVLVVAVVVFIRYGEPLVAAPMVVTALSEVAILLGVFAAAGFAIDLSHIAGFIAVIGTGVDDLVIIADEVMAEGDVSSRRVFRSRFRKAFWIIGGAAATTIIAMSPLAFFDLGNLRGFALVTILGVLIGVLITRPAYGDILRWLMTDR